MAASVALVASLSGPEAAARTTPNSGAVGLPPGVELQTPLPCGVRTRVTCSYGCGGHTGTVNGSSSNDYYALDIQRDEAGGGDGKPLVAAATGVVRYASWATGGWSSYGLMVLIEHDFGDGHRYVTLYAHMSKIGVAVGQKVVIGETIGNMGSTGNSTAPHVHFAVHRDAKIAGGPYGGTAVVPEPLGGRENLSGGGSWSPACVNTPPPPPSPPRPPSADQGVRHDARAPVAPRADAGVPSAPAPVWNSPDAGTTAMLPEAAPEDHDNPTAVMGGCSAAGGSTRDGLLGLLALGLALALVGPRRARRNRAPSRDR